VRLARLEAEAPATAAALPGRDRWHPTAAKLAAGAWLSGGGRVVLGWLVHRRHGCVPFNY